MSTYPYTTWPNAGGLTAANLNQRFSELQAQTYDLRNGVDDFIKVVLDRSTLTIAGDTITPVKSWHKIDTESTAASDNLATISTPTDGQILDLSIVSASRIVIVKHNTSNIWLSTECDRVLDDPREVLRLRYDSDNSRWCEVGQPVGVEKILTYNELSSSQSSITINVQPIYRAIRIVGGFRTDRAAVLDDVLLRLNGDSTTTNYYAVGQAFSTGVVFQEILGSVGGYVIYAGAAGASATANYLGSFELIVFNPMMSTAPRNIEYHGFISVNNTTANSGAISGGGRWQNAAAAVSSLTLLPRTGSNFVAKTHYTVYGMT